MPRGRTRVTIRSGNSGSKRFGVRLRVRISATEVALAMLHSEVWSTLEIPKAMRTTAMWRKSTTPTRRMPTPSERDGDGE